MKSGITDEFIACFERLPMRVRRVARKNYRTWKANPAHPSLEFKRVGRKSPIYSIRVGLGWRALGLLEDGEITWVWIGSHAEYDRIIKNA